MKLALALPLLVVATTALADGELKLEVEVGKTVERDVLYATGWFCDDASLVRGDMITRADHNFWVLTGIKEGATQCRVGTDFSRVHFVFNVHVVAKRKR